MIGWATLVAGLGIWGLGRLLLGFRLLGGSGQRSCLEMTSLACLLGLGLWAALIMTLGLVMPIASLPSGLGLGLCMALFGGAAAVTWKARGSSLTCDPQPWSVAERGAAALVALFAMFAAFYAASMPVHIFDPVFHFAYKGKLLFHEGLMGPGWTDLEDSVGRVITHPDYPPGVGAIECLVSSIQGDFVVDQARPLLALFTLAMGGLLFARLRPVSRRAALTGSLLWLSMPFMYYSRLPHHNWVKGFYGLFFGSAAGEARFGGAPGGPGSGPNPWKVADGWTLDGAGDLPLAALFSAGALLLFMNLCAKSDQRRRGDFIIAGLLLGGGALMKNEGLALLPVAVVAAALTWFVQRPDALKATKSLACTFGLAFVIASPWLAVRSSVPSIGEDYPSRLTPSGLIEAATSTQEIRVSMANDGIEQQLVPRIVAGGFIDAIVAFPRFGLVWLLFGASLLFALLRPKERLRGAILPVALVIIGAFCLYALVLVVTPWNLDALFKTAIPDRLIFHVAPLAIFVLVTIFEGDEHKHTGS